YMTEEFNNLFTCYDLGIERLKNIHFQEITKEIPYITKGQKEKN
ncbi:18145_t:CDS:1, partial [Cetraspora pellucida]